jgi:hypothetical protein
MFKEIQSGLAKFFTKEFVLVVIICFVLMWGLLSYSGEKYSFKDNMEGGSTQTAIDAPPAASEVAAPVVQITPPLLVILVPKLDMLFSPLLTPRNCCLPMEMFSGPN